jgi:hypothetical protein
LLFAVSIALNAGLLFLIQPLIAKMILPVLGGSPAVWNTSLLFYQFCLMLGYGYAHFGNLWLGRRAHALIHLDLTPGTGLIADFPARRLACRSDHTPDSYIDPVVEKIARNEELFTYLRDCPPQIEVVIGDARISLASAPANAYDIVVLDAFSSDEIPIHLLTREALELYRTKMAADGMLVFHISNRYFDLAPR